MERFVADLVPTDVSKTMRLAHLLRAMLSPGVLGLSFGEQHTHTASDAFYKQQANCLAFSNLFVALARESGLNAKYQDVLVSPQWEMTERSMTLRRHVNVTVQMSRSVARVVDISPNRNKLLQLESALLTDEQAFAQFYNNRAIDYLYEENYHSAFLNVRKALLLDPKAAFIWSNLGVILGRLDRAEHAEAVLLHARTLNPAEQAAMVNLLRLYRQRGDAEKEAFYERQVAHYQNSNPYHLLLRARKAYFDKDLDQTERLLERALAIKPEEELMYELKARVHVERAEQHHAKKALRKAIRFTKSAEAKQQYEARLEQLGRPWKTSDNASAARSSL